MVEPDTLIATLLGDNGFQPLEAQTLEQAGLNEALVDSLIQPPALPPLPGA